MRVLAFSGSFRRDSLNTQLLREAVRLAPADMEVHLWEGLDSLPHFSPERDVEPLPGPVADLHQRLRASEALIISTPEYIHAMPGALKNALEWLVSSGICVGKPVAAWSASPSMEGGARAHASLVHTLEVMSARVVVEASLCLTLARSSLTPEGRLPDPAHEARLSAALTVLSKAAGAGEQP